MTSGVAGDFVTNDNTLTFSGTDTATGASGSRLGIWLSGGIYGTGTNIGSVLLGATSTTWKLSYGTALADGTYTVTLTDGVTSSSPALSTQALVIDTHAPAAPDTLILAVASDLGASNTDRITNVRTPTITGNAEAFSTVQLYDTDGTTVLGTATADLNGAWTVTSATLSDAVHTLTARATDAAGNAGAVSASVSVTIDSVVPAAPGVALAHDTGTPGDSVTSDPSLTLTGTEPGATVEYSANGGAWTPTAPGVANLIQDSNTVQVRQTDVAGNVSSLGSVLFMLDSAAPAAPGVALANDTGTPGDLITSDPSLTLTGTEVGATVEYSAIGGAWTPTAPSVANLIQDSNTVEVRQTDVAGNVSSPGSVVFTLDSAAPAAPGLALAHDTGSPGDSVTSDPSLTLAGTEPGATVEYSANGGAWTTTAPGVGNLSQGPDTVEVRQTDVAGNVSSPGSVSFTLDSVAPATPGVALTTDTGTPGDLITSDPSLTLTGTETGATVEYSANGGAWTTAAPGVGNLGQGPDTVEVRQTDVAGNVSSPGSVSFTLDSILPATPGVALTTDTGNPTDGVTSNPGLTLTGAETGATVEYSADKGTTWTATAPGVGNLGQGLDTVQVRQTDVAGNVSSLGSVSFTLDSVAPAAPVVALVNDTGTPGDLITSDPGLTLTGTEAGATVEYSANGSAWTTAAPGGVLGQGLDTVQVRQTDVAGNVSSPSSVSFALDSVAPVAPGVTLTNDTGTPGDLITSDPSLTLAGIETGATVAYPRPITAAPGRQRHRVLPIWYRAATRWRRARPTSPAMCPPWAVLRLCSRPSRRLPRPSPARPIPEVRGS